MTQPAPPAGWYPGPEGGDGRRYWTGTAWADPTTTTTAPQKSGSPTKAIIGVAVLVLVLGGACVAIKATHNSSAPTTSVSTTATHIEGPPSAGPVQSKVMPVTLPAGTSTVGKDAGAIPGIEVWHVPLEPAAAVDYLRPQLPTGPYDGLPACPVIVTQNKYSPAPITTWVWENTAGDAASISVGTLWLPDHTAAPGSEVTISRGQETTPAPC